MMPIADAQRLTTGPNELDGERGAGCERSH
jgi:hypothetical protein